MCLLTVLLQSSTSEMRFVWAVLLCSASLVIFCDGVLLLSTILKRQFKNSKRTLQYCSTVTGERDWKTTSVKTTAGD